MSAVALVKAGRMPVKRRHVWLIVGVVTLLHISTAGIVKYGLPEFVPRKSELMIELGGVMPRGEGGTGGRRFVQPVTPVPEKSPLRDENVTRRAPEPLKQNIVAPSQEAGATAGVESAPTIDADYKAAYLNNPKPPYPSMAFQMRVEGTVNVKALVLPDGSCGEVLLGRSSGNELLDQSALSTVARWKFTPAQKQGKEIAQWVSIPITFALKRR